MSKVNKINKMNEIQEIINVIRFLTREGVCNDMQNEILSYYDLISRTVKKLKKANKYKRKLEKHSEAIYEGKRLENKFCICCGNHCSSITRRKRIYCSGCSAFSCCYIENTNTPRDMVQVDDGMWFCSSCIYKKCVVCCDKVKKKERNTCADCEESIICNRCFGQSDKVAYYCYDCKNKN